MSPSSSPRRPRPRPRRAARIDAEWEPLPVRRRPRHRARRRTPRLPGARPTATSTARTGSARATSDDGWAAADVVVEGTYEVPYQEHAYLQPEAGLGYVDDEGRVTVVVAGQWAHEDRQQIAHALACRSSRSA